MGAIFRGSRISIVLLVTIAATACSTNSHSAETQCLEIKSGKVVQKTKGPLKLVKISNGIAGQVAEFKLDDNYKLVDLTVGGTKTPPSSISTAKGRFTLWQINEITDMEICVAPR